MTSLDLKLVLAALSNHTLALSIALLAILLLRAFSAQFLHPHWRYALWLALPLAFFSLHLPKHELKAAVPTIAVMAASAPMGNLQVSEPRSAAHDFAPALIALWILGALISLVLLARSYRQAFLLARNGVVSPCLVGIFAPILMLPVNFAESFSVAQQRLIIEHETFHRHRRDPFFNLVAQVLHCLFWFHPLMPMAMRAFRDDQEMSCDAAIITSQPEYAACYAQALTLCAVINAEPSQLWCQWRPIHPLLERITMLKHLKQNRFRNALGASLLSTALLSVSWLSFASAPAEHSQQNYWIGLQVLRNEAVLATVALRASELQPGSVEIGQDSELANGQAVLRPELQFQIQPSSDGDRTHLDIQSVWQSRQSSGEFIEHFSLTLAATEKGEFQLIHPETKERLTVKLASRPAAAAEPAPSLPDYPKAAWLLGINGKVIVNVSVDANGVVQSADVASAQPAGVFEQSALAEARAKHYPAQTLAAGETVRWLQLPVHYRLED